MQFQSTPPRRRRPTKVNRILRQFDFNPRLREGGDARCCVVQPKLFISIHASAKEATYLLWMGKRKWMISIHASAKEATDSYLSTVSRGRISIHASAKEATAQGDTVIDKTDKFQSTPPRRRRRYRGALFYSRDDFNPRLREGGDSHYWLWYLISQLYFNPRLREGGDRHDS